MTNAKSQSERNQMLDQTVGRGYELSKAEDIKWTIGRTKELIAEGADVNYIDSRSGNSTVLCHAISGGNPEIIQLLLDHGAKITFAALLTACNRAGLAVNGAAFLKRGEFSQTRIDTREKIALMIIAKAAKEDFIGTNWEKKTVLDFAAPSAIVTEALKEAMKSKGLTEAGLSSPKEKAKKFIKQKLRHFKP